MKRKPPPSANTQEPIELSPAVREIAGSIPPDVDLDALRDEYLREKYGLTLRAAPRKSTDK